MSIPTFPAVAILLALAVALGGCYPNPQPAGLTPIPTLALGGTAAPVAAVSPQPTAAPVQQAVTTGDAGQGATLFDQDCSSCHGKGGQGGAVGPKLAKSQYIQSAGDPAILATISNGRPGSAMPAWSQAKGGRLTDAQINDVMAYLHTLQ
jgi:mono/diheme cytochrome c family protein